MQVLKLKNTFDYTPIDEIEEIVLYGKTLL